MCSLLYPEFKWFDSISGNSNKWMVKITLMLLRHHFDTGSQTTNFKTLVGQADCRLFLRWTEKARYMFVVTSLCVCLKPCLATSLMSQQGRATTVALLDPDSGSLCLVYSHLLKFSSITRHTKWVRISAIVYNPRWSKSSIHSYHCERFKPVFSLLEAASHWGYFNTSKNKRPYSKAACPRPDNSNC